MDRSCRPRAHPGGRIGGDVLAQAPPQARQLGEPFFTGWTGALDDILLVAAAIALLGALVAVSTVRQQDFHGPPVPGA